MPTADGTVGAFVTQLSEERRKVALAAQFRLGEFLVHLVQAVGAAVSVPGAKSGGEL